MRRRDVLAAIGCGLVPGCAQFLGSNDDGSTTIGETTTTSTTTTITYAAEPIERQPELVIGTYEAAVSLADSGTATLDTALAAYSSAGYDRAESEANRARRTFQMAEDLFEQAHAESLNLGTQAAVQICADALDWAAIMITAAENLQHAAYYARDGDTEQRTNHFETYQTNREDAATIGLKRPSALETVIEH